MSVASWPRKFKGKVLKNELEIKQWCSCRNGNGIRSAKKEE